VRASMQRRRPLRPVERLTGICLRNICSCHEILRGATGAGRQATPASVCAYLSRRRRRPLPLRLRPLPLRLRRRGRLGRRGGHVYRTSHQPPQCIG
jgi:hypothetical protein